MLNNNNVSFSSDYNPFAFFDHTLPLICTIFCCIGCHHLDLSGTNIMVYSVTGFKIKFEVQSKINPYTEPKSFSPSMKTFLPEWDFGLM